MAIFNSYVSLPEGMVYLPTFARTKSPSHVGKEQQAPWFAYGTCFIQ